MGTYIGLLLAGIEMTSDDPTKHKGGKGWTFANNHIGLEEPPPPHSTYHVITIVMHHP